MSMTKALVKVVRALQVVDRQNRRPARRSGGRAPHHWHVTFCGRSKYTMARVGFNHRTRRWVYQCPFPGCGGKAERPY